MEATEFILPESGIKGYISNGMQLCIPNDPCVNILLLASGKIQRCAKTMS